MRLRDFMQSPVRACSPTATLAMAAREMEIHNVGSLVVTDPGEMVLGILTDRDLALSLGHGYMPDAAVTEVMSRHVTTISVDASLEEAASAMDSHAVRRLPVVDAQGKAIGIVCIDDLYNYLTQETITLSGVIRSQGVPQG